MQLHIHKVRIQLFLHKYSLIMDYIKHCCFTNN